jgi:hypothetical protein
MPNLLVRSLAGALGACCLMSLPACSDPTAPTPAEVNLPVGSLTYVRPVPQDLVSGLGINIGRLSGKDQIGNGATFLCLIQMQADGATFRCGLPVTLLADTEYWIRVDDPARPTPPPNPGICGNSFAVADGISVLNQNVVRSTTLTSFNLFCSWPVGVFKVSPTGEVR